MFKLRLNGERKEMSVFRYIILFILVDSKQVLNIDDNENKYKFVESMNVYHSER